MRWIALALLLGSSGMAFAQSLPFNIAPDPNSLINADLRNSIVTSMGIAFAHRPYEPATPMKSRPESVSIGLELTMIKVPEKLNTALLNQGLPGLTLPFLPNPELHIRKAIGTKGDIGFSIMWYRIVKIMGGDAKLAVYEPEEGPCWAIRLNYTDAKIDFVESEVWEPQLLISRNLDYADPYLGIGYQWISGGINYTIPNTPIPLPPIVVSGRGTNFQAFTGVQFRLTGLDLSLEGAYSYYGAPTLGVKVGFAF